MPGSCQAQIEQKSGSTKTAECPFGFGQKQDSDKASLVAESNCSNNKSPQLIESKKDN